MWDWSERDPLRAEHGYALMLTIHREGRRESILYDAGLGRDSVAHNLEVLDLKPAEFRAMVLSHALAARLPGAFIQSNVGTRLHFAAAPDRGSQAVALH